MATRKKQRPPRRKVAVLNQPTRSTSTDPRPDAPPKIRCDRGDIEVLRKGYRHRYENQLDKLYELTKDKPGGLRRHHVDAGKRLNADFTRAGIDTMAMLDLEKFMGGGGAVAADDMRAGERQQFFRQRFRAAMKAVGPTSARILYAVCCENFTVTDYSRHMFYDRKTHATFRLVEALDDLAIHYGMMKPKGLKK